MNDFSIETIIKVSIDAVIGDFSDWLVQEGAILLYNDVSQINGLGKFELINDEIIIYLFQNSIYSTIITNKRVLSLTDKNIDVLIFKDFKRIKKPKQYYMEAGEVKKLPFINYITIVSVKDEVFNVYGENETLLYFLLILISNFSFIEKEGRYFHLPNKYRDNPL